MKYAVKIEGARLPYACVGCHPRPCRVDHERKPFFSDFLRATNDITATTDDRSKAEAVAKARGGRVVRVLSHEEATRKAAAVELLSQARRLYEMAEELEPRLGDDGCDGDEFNEGHASGLSAAAYDLEERAEVLWPALFHAGDGKAPRGK